MGSQTDFEVLAADTSSRLKGGQVAKESDDLRDALELSDVEESAPSATQKKKIKFLEKEPVQQLEKSQLKSRWSIALKYSIMTVLSLIVLIAIILLAMKELKSKREYMLTIAPSENFYFKIPRLRNGLFEMEVTAKGPFKRSEGRKDFKANLPVLRLYLPENVSQRKLLAGEVWEIPLVDSQKFDTAEIESRSFTFPVPEGTSVMNVLTENVDIDLTVLLEVELDPIDKNKGVIYGAVVLSFLYFMIVTEIVDRTFASLVAAALSLGLLAFFNHRPTADHIIEWIDVETLVLLVGMMILVAILAESGIFDYFAVYAYKVAKGRIWPLINCLCFFTAALASFLDSVTMMLLATPVTIRLCEVLSVNPIPVLICMVLFANIGAAVTPVGDPPNVIITLNPQVIASNVNFGNFMLHMFPGVILGLILAYIHVRLLYRKIDKLKSKESDELVKLRQEIGVWERTLASISPISEDEDIARETIQERIENLKKKLEEAEAEGPSKNDTRTFEETLAHLTQQYPLRDKVLLIQAGLVFIFVIIMFLASSVVKTSFSFGWSAIVGALLLIVIADKRDLEAVLSKIEWSTLLFFASLFVTMEALTILGVIDLIVGFIVKMIESVDANYQLMVAIVLVVWVSGIASAFLDNIPVTAVMIKIILKLSEDEALHLPLHPLVWSLAYGACFGGNGTLIGASANVVTVGVAGQHGYKISFIHFFVVCFPIMLGSLSVATIYLLIAHVAFEWHEK